MNLDGLLSVHADALRLRARRTTLLAENIANGDTPGYKARDLDFGDALSKAGAGTLPLARTAAGHIPHAPHGGAARVLYRVPDGPSLDGNTVDKDQEQARFAENAMRYEASLQFAKKRVDSLVRTLRGE